MSTHCFKRLLGTLLVGAAFSLVGTTPAFAVNPSQQLILELDADSVPNNASGLIGPAHDWDQAPGAPGGSFSALGTTATTGIVADLVPRVFTQGSKDTKDLDQWAWRGGSSPPKADIQNAYAAAYNASNGDLLIFFGANRLSVNGTVATGFWFFKNPVCAKSNGTFGQGAADSTGACINPSAPPAQHAIGDTLVAVNYDNGGHIGTIAIYQWGSGGLGAPTTSTNTSGLSGLFCDSTGDAACAITNSGTPTVAWTPPNGSSTMAPGQFFEGGIDVQALGISGGPCFSSFLATSRSSTTANAEIKNFVLGNFPVCKISVSKTCTVTRLTKPEDNTSKLYVADYSGNVKNEGSGSLPTGTVITITDDVGTPGNTSDDQTQTITLSSLLPQNGTVAFTGEFFTDDNPPFNTVTAKATFDSSTITAEPFGIKCGPLQLNPALEVKKDCLTVLDVVNGKVVAKVIYSGQACVRGDVPLSVTITDAPKNGTDSSSLPSGVVVNPTTDNCLTTGILTYSGSYYPTQANDGVTDPATAKFSDTVTAVGTNQAVEDQKATITATCPLCP